MRQASRLMLAGLALGVAVTGGGVVWSHLASQRAIAMLERYSIEPGRFDAAGLALDQARLYAAALETLAGAPPVLLRQRYEAFVASIARIRGDEWRVHFASLPRFEETLVQLDALVARIDDLLGTSASVPGAAMPQAAVIELTRLLPPLREPLADLALAFDAATSVQVVQAVRRLERIRQTEALATGAFLVAVLGLATAGLVIVRGLPKGEDVEFPVSAPVFAGAPILAATARDLAGPLHRIAGTFGMVLDTPGLDAESTRAARAALDAAEDLLDLSDALGDAASLAAGRADPLRAPFDPVETVGDVLRSLETRVSELGGRAALVGGPLRSAAPQGRSEGEEPALLAVGDAPRFVRLLKALIVRMLPLAPGATLGIAVRFEGEKLALLVGDSSAATLRGGAFETVDLREAWPGQDLSDGLSPAIALAEAMGGELTRARAGAGRSETVRAVLPFAPRAADAVEDTEAAAPRSLTLLAVDDVPTNRRLLAAMLERHHHVCDTAADATEALRLLRERPYDAVLMDVQMPGTDGLAATRMIRALPPPVGQIPVIAVTAHVLPEQHETFRAAGMNGVIAKPVATAALLDELSRVVVQRVSSLHPTRAETVALLDEETLTFVRSTLSPADFARFVERQTAEGAAALADAEAALRRGDQKGVAAAARAVASAYEAVGAPRVAAMARHLEEAASPQGIAQLREAAEATEAALRSRATGARQQGWSGQQATTI
ncbi:response regulator [Elioraea rosea]|uniref:response regulator n=1 Tax=Elioraea rosea TaxID=2492390 RepID=UPI001182B539|nr:response regulator [Elioraea rosea]